MKMVRVLAPIAVLLVLFAGCSESDDSDNDVGVDASSEVGPRALTVHAVVGQVDSVDAPASRAGNAVVTDDDGSFLEIGPAELDASDVASATAAANGGLWTVTVEFTRTGDAKFSRLSEAAGCAVGPPRRIALLSDGEVLSSPEVNVPCGTSITGSTEISGNFTESEATSLAKRILLASGG